MPTRCKIKIQDNTFLRAEIDNIYEELNQVQAAQWALLIAIRIAKSVGIDYINNEVIKKGFQVNESRQEGKASMHEVRQAGFALHNFARATYNELQRTALRTIGQAISSGHMKEHAMVASDYAIKTIGLLTHDNIDAINQERQAQLEEIRVLKNRRNKHQT